MHAMPWRVECHQRLMRVAFSSAITARFRGRIVTSAESSDPSIAKSFLVNVWRPTVQQISASSNFAIRPPCMSTHSKDLQTYLV